MSRVSRVNAITLLSDSTLGAFAFVPSSATLDHLVRYLSTWSGTECVLSLSILSMIWYSQILLCSKLFTVLSDYGQYAECALNRLTLCSSSNTR